jgi:hypothetical protein
VNTRAALGLTAGALVVGVLAGFGLRGGDSGAKKVVGPGPTRTVRGVAVGFQQSREGAASAALNYETALTAAGPAGYRSVLDVVAVPSSRSAIGEEMRPGMDMISKQIGEDAFLRSAVVGYRIKSYDTNVADIEIWEVGVLAASSQPVPQAGWTTTTLRVQWADHDWRVAQAPTSTKGPTPQQPDAATEIGRFIETIRPFLGAQYVVSR